MKSYRVNWDIDIDAKNPKDAAKQALAIQRDPQSTATLFDVFEQDMSQGHLGDGQKTLVDVKPQPARPAVKIRATDDDVKITIGRERFKFSEPGMLSGSDLSDILEALGIVVDYEYND